MADKGIKVISLEFGKSPFRKLAKLKIDFADRFTLIGGHNGIGKSTILGLVANTFGNTEKRGPKSYFGEPFSANIERIVYLSLDEVSKTQELATASPVVTADVGGVPIRKRCAMTLRSDWKRARVVPRTIGKAEDDPVGQDAKIPLPTIYLGMRRLASFGEADEHEVDSKAMSMDAEDASLMANFVSSVILGCQVNAEVTHQSIKGSRKKTVQPGYDKHDALAVSMGQDSLGSIATALASFNRLKRESGDEYVGGLLVIDELDVGFHPHAIDRLVQELKSHAKRLDLQIIATTHSPRLIENIHPQGKGNSKSPDTVIYLVDTKHPRLAEDQSLAAILADMELREDDEVAEKKPTLCIYFEDPEGAQFFDALVPTAKRGALGRKHGVQIKLVPLGLPGSNLIALPEKDALFKNRVLVVDADIKIPKKAALRGNTVKLPCAQGSKGTNRSPENTIKQFLRDVSDAEDGELHEALLRFKVTNPSSDKVQSTFFSKGNASSTDRDNSKDWWVTHWGALKNWGVIREWATCHQLEVQEFVEDFESAVASTSERLKLNSSAVN